MYGFARTGVLLLVCFAIIDNCYSTTVTDNNEEDFEAGKLILSATLSNKYSITNFRVENGKENSTMGFSVSPIRRFSEKKFTGCYLQEEHLEPFHRVVFFLLDFANNQIQVNCSSSWNYLWIYESEYTKEPDMTSKTTFKPLTMKKVKSDEKYSYYDFQFYIKLGAPDKALYFHNCDREKVSYDLEYELVPSNDDFPPRNNKEPSYDVFSIVMDIILCCSFLLLGLYRVYIYKASQNTLKCFHYVLLIIVFLQALYYLLEGIRCCLNGIYSGYSVTDIIDPFIYVTKGLIVCCIITLAIQGWIYVKNIFGPKEKYFVMIILIVQSILWITVYVCEQLKWTTLIYGFDLEKLELFFVPVILVYFLIRRAGWRKDKAKKNLKKFQLFRFVCLMIAFVFYFVNYCLVLLIRTEIFSDYDLLFSTAALIFTLICFVMFYAILLHKLQPKFIKEITVLKTKGVLLPLY